MRLKLRRLLIDARGAGCLTQAGLGALLGCNECFVSAYETGGGGSRSSSSSRLPTRGGWMRGR